MTPKRGLGRGLGALLGDAPTTDVTTPPPRGLVQIRARAHRSQSQSAAQDIRSATLDELRASIAEFGVLVPIIVRTSGEDYELIAGERRWRAANAAGLERFPQSCVKPTNANHSKSRSSKICSATTSIRSKKRWALRT